MVAVLTVLLPVTFAVGVAARRPVPARDVQLAAFERWDTQTEVWRRNDLFQTVPVNVRLLRSPTGSVYSIQFAPAKNYAKPDLLVYWTADTSAVTDRLPDDARLLGGFYASLPLQLPDEATSAGGALVLYSLADHEIVDVSKPTRFDDSSR
jgi:hypothetical protein